MDLNYDFWSGAIWSLICVLVGALITFAIMLYFSYRDDDKPPPPPPPPDAPLFPPPEWSKEEESDEHRLRD